MADIFPEVYSKAKRQAIQKYGMVVDIFPANAPFTPGQVLDPDFLPE